EWIELAALGLGCCRTGANRLAGSTFGAVTKQLFGKHACTRFVLSLVRRRACGRCCGRAGHGLCARLLPAAGPKLGEGARPDLGTGAEDEGLATEVQGAESGGAYLLIRLLAAETIGFTKVFER